MNMAVSTTLFMILNASFELFLNMLNLKKTMFSSWKLRKDKIIWKRTIYKGITKQNTMNIISNWFKKRWRSQKRYIKNILIKLLQNWVFKRTYMKKVLRNIRVFRNLRTPLIIVRTTFRRKFWGSTLPDHNRAARDYFRIIQPVRQFPKS